MYFFFTVGGRGHVQSLILGALLLGLGFLIFLVGLLADLISANRMMLEKLDWRLNKIEEDMEGSSNRKH
jgi:hypothetical protein